MKNPCNGGKVNCYDCKWRHDISGDAHSECHVGDLHGMYGGILLLGLGKTPRMNPHGVSHGWCNWPFNFDPLWIDACVWFYRKEDAHETDKCSPVSEAAETPVPKREESVQVENTTTTSK